MNKSYDPKLKEAVEEIKKITRKYDVGAHVTLVSRTHAEYLYDLSPSWSASKIMPTGNLRIRATEKDYGNKEKRNEALSLTVHMILQIRDIAAQTFIMAENIEKELSKVMEIEHVPFNGGDYK